MLQLRIAALFVLLLSAAGCGEGSTLPTSNNVVGAWTSRVTSGMGTDAISQTDHLGLGADGRFTWVRMTFGDGLGRPGVPTSRMDRTGEYRIRDEFFAIRTQVTERFGMPAWTSLERIEVADAPWSGDHYRMAVDGSRMTLTYTLGGVQVTQFFQRVRD